MKVYQRTWMGPTLESSIAYRNSRRKAMGKILRFVFNRRGEDQERVEGDMALGIFGAKCMHGRPRVRMETRYMISPGESA